MNEYTEEQIRADVQLIEQADLDDDLALALMRLAHALCGSSLLRGLIARTHRANAIVRTINERRAGGQTAGGKRVDDGSIQPSDLRPAAQPAYAVASVQALNTLSAAVQIAPNPHQRCPSKPFLAFYACCGGVVEGDRVHRCGPPVLTCPGCGKPSAPGSWCCVSPDEPAAECMMCSAEYSRAEYDELDTARESHFRGCTRCGYYEVRPT